MHFLGRFSLAVANCGVKQQKLWRSHMLDVFWYQAVREPMFGFAFEITLLCTITDAKPTKL